MLKNITIGNKLKLNLALIMVGLLFLGVNTFFSLKNLNNEYQVSSKLSA